jgi:hypothetical protein
VCLIVCDEETLTVKWPKPKLGCCATGKQGSVMRHFGIIAVETWGMFYRCATAGRE